MTTRTHPLAPPALFVGRLMISAGSLLAAVAAGAFAVHGARQAYAIPGATMTAVVYAVAAVGLGIVAVMMALDPEPAGRVSAAAATGALALAWCALPLLEIPGGSAPMRAAAGALGALIAPALLHLAVALTRSKALVSWVITAYVICGGVGLARTLVTNPFLDPSCRRACDAEVILILASPEASRVLADALLVTTGATYVAAATIALVALCRASRSVATIALVPLLGASLIELTAVLIPGSRPILGPPLPGAGESVLLARCIAAATVAGALIPQSVHRARRLARFRAAFADIARSYGPISLEVVLRRALRDPGLRVAYWLPSLGSWTDSTGIRQSDGSSAHNGALSIVRNGAPVARVTTTRIGLDSAELESVVGAAATLIVDNERRRVELRCQENDLRDSRRRLVEAADVERRRAERDLHDGAQHRLLAASWSLRLACEEASDPATTALARRRLDDVLALLASVREISHGVYPPTLSADGLVPALESLARRTQITHLSINAHELPHLDSAVEFTAFLTVHEAVVNDRAPRVIVTLSRTPEYLVVEIAGVREYRVERLADRVGALGGSIVQDRDRVRVEVPCASSSPMTVS